MNGGEIMDEKLNDIQYDMNLYKQFLLGDKQSFNLLIIKYRKALTNFITYYVKEIEIAEDIAQDSFLYMIINKKEYNFKYSFRTYLYTIAKSRTLNYLKKERKKISLESIDFINIDSILNVEDEILHSLDREEIDYAIRKQKKEYQIILSLYYFQKFKYK